MINIAICDDEIEQLDIIECLIKENLAQTKFSCQLIRFSKGSELIDMAQKEKLSAVFLDIDMPEMNGIEVARELAKDNKNMRIFFISNHENMVFEAIHVRPMRFIRKRYMESELAEAVCFLARELTKESRVINFTSGKTSHELKCGEIIYIESEGHYLRIISESGVVRIRGKISEYVQELKEHYFLQVQKGILLNMKYISAMKGEKVFLRSGEDFTISRGNRDEIKREFLKYMRKEM